VLIGLFLNLDSCYSKWVSRTQITNIDQPFLECYHALLNTPLGFTCSLQWMPGLFSNPLDTGLIQCSLLHKVNGLTPPPTDRYQYMLKVTCDTLTIWDVTLCRLVDELERIGWTFYHQLQVFYPEIYSCLLWRTERTSCLYAFFNVCWFIPAVAKIPTIWSKLTYSSLFAILSYNGKVLETGFCLRLRSETETRPFYWAHLSGFHMKTETESSLRNTVFK
jgi:hypothetical protein